MNQKTRFKNFAHWPIGIGGRYIGIGPKKIISVDL